MLVYHGSDHVIAQPIFNGIKRANDYGYGFYTTENIELAKEWACSKNQDGFVNVYEADLDKLKILNLNAPEYNILNWLAILTKYRTYWQNGSISEQAKDYLQKHFYIDPAPYDVIIGYRADDSYFSFAQDFVAGTISVSKLSEAMHLGKLGEQIVFKSKESLSHISFVRADPVESSVYFERKKNRDTEARQAYRKTKSSSDNINDLYMLDIMREEIKNDDPRLR
ncbi:Protein of unknown function [Succinivibrio dextrinosolvens DSM 3072]|uniref:DUF3990 domain-containing protein n=1 Tax=Succinivibrio dextrinosolvens DSM 3072 TaxID=1123324 RepID=A0A1T4VNP2_9GAMM|nr:DUF3990 domain-containing protein [Succinivibrio dextrinosolvens]SKA66602.1 Protein of unknown function [Succinivibrio dextrinosolvens DSM 3072]